MLWLETRHNQGNQICDVKIRKQFDSTKVPRYIRRQENSPHNGDRELRNFPSSLLSLRDSSFYKKSSPRSLRIIPLAEFPVLGYRQYRQEGPLVNGESGKSFFCATRNYWLILSGKMVGWLHGNN